MTQKFSDFCQRLVRSFKSLHSAFSTCGPGLFFVFSLSRTRLHDSGPVARGKMAVGNYCHAICLDIFTTHPPTTNFCKITDKLNCRKKLGHTISNGRWGQGSVSPLSIWSYNSSGSHPVLCHSYNSLPYISSLVLLSVFSPALPNPFGDFFAIKYSP